MTLIHAYKKGALSLPPEAAEAATLRLDVPCRQCPILKKGERPVGHFLGAPSHSAQLHNIHLWQKWPGCTD